MKRELLQQSGKHGYDCRCCPGHDKWPNDTYSSNRSKRARARDIKVEHQAARSVANRSMVQELRNTNYEDETR